jgi:serine/threonine protein kinase
VTRVLGSRYVLSSVIGRGAMGEVWEGRSRTDDERVAVKILRPELADDASVIARFVQERSILVGLSGPHLVEVRDLVLEGGTLAIVMEYVPGSDLRKYLNRYGTLRPALAVRLVAQISEGLALVHAAGVVHRDVKPENVLLDLTDPAAPIAKVSDFGVSRITYGPRLTRLTGLIGTPEYMAPEVAERDMATPAADLYSVGILLYELLAGRTPFAGGHPIAVLKRHLEAPPPPIDGIPGQLWTIIESLLAKDPDERPSDAAVVSEHLMAMSSGLDGVEAAPPQEPPGPMGVTPSWLSPLPRELDAATQLRGVNKPVAELSATASIGERRGLVPDSEEQSEPNETRLGIRAIGEATPLAARVRRPFRKRRSTRILLPTVLALVAASVCVPIALAARTHRASSAHVAAPPANSSYSFNPQRYPDGLVVSQRWNLIGDGSHFQADLIASNPTNQPLKTSFDIAIPKSLAASASHDVTFTPSPRIITDDPVVAYDLNLAAHGQQNLRYSITTSPDGAKLGRLQQWATDVAETVLPGPKPIPISLTSLKITPAKLPPLQIGKTGRLVLTGTDSTHKALPAAVLSAAAWTTSNPLVVALSQTGQATTITAVAAGTSVITAKIGTTQTPPLTVTVTGGSESGPTGPNSPRTLADSGPKTSTHTSPPRPTKPSTSIPPPPAPGPEIPRIHSLIAVDQDGSGGVLTVTFCAPGQTNTTCTAQSGTFARNPTITVYACAEGDCSGTKFPAASCGTSNGLACYNWANSINVAEWFRVFVIFTANGKPTQATLDSLMTDTVLSSTTSDASGNLSIVSCDLLTDITCNDGEVGKLAGGVSGTICADGNDCNAFNRSVTPTDCGGQLCWNLTGLQPNTRYSIKIAAYAPSNPNVTSTVYYSY